MLDEGGGLVGGRGGQTGLEDINQVGWFFGWLSVIGSGAIH